MNYKKEAEKLRDEYANADCGRCGWCDTEKCPLWGNHKGRQDGYCVAETYLDADYLIGAYEEDIRNLEMKIGIMREMIVNLKSFKKRFEEYLEEKK